MPKLTDFVDWMEVGYVYLFCTAVLRFNKIFSKGFIRIQFCWCLKNSFFTGAQRWDSHFTTVAIVNQPEKLVNPNSYTECLKFFLQ